MDGFAPEMRVVTDMLNIPYAQVIAVITKT